MAAGIVPNALHITEEWVRHRLNLQLDSLGEFLSNILASYLALLCGWRSAGLAKYMWPIHAQLNC